MRTMTELMTEKENQQQLPSGLWAPAKYLITTKQRIKDAWAVLTGEAEAVKWE
jgi:hypothetical protein